jgi:flagellar hook-associated protein 3 FlgL
VRLEELDAAREQVSRAIARVGAIQNRLDRTEEDLADFELGLETLLSETIDADYAEVIVELNAQSNAYTAALQAGAQVIQPSLLNFLG